MLLIHPHGCVVSLLLSELDEEDDVQHSLPKKGEVVATGAEISGDDIVLTEAVGACRLS